VAWGKFGGTTKIDGAAKVDLLNSYIGNSIPPAHHLPFRPKPNKSTKQL
jgi:hypothetical protein